MAPVLYQGQDKSGKNSEAVSRQLGLGPIPVEVGRWGGVRLIKGGVILEYEVGGVKVKGTSGSDVRRQGDDFGMGRSTAQGGVQSSVGIQG